MAYRECKECVKAELAVLVARHHRALDAIPTGHRHLYVRRTARLVAGLTGTGVALVIAIAMLRGTGGYARMVLAGCGALPIVYAVAAATASRALHRTLRQVVRHTNDPFRDLAALRAVDLAEVERELTDRNVDASYAWPLIAITLLVPATLQVGVGLAIGASCSDLDEWLLITSVFSLHVYGYAIAVAWRYPRKPRAWPMVTGATTLSLLPGVLCGCISSFVVFLCAVIVVAVGYRPMAKIMAREAGLDPALGEHLTGTPA